MIILNTFLSINLPTRPHSYNIRAELQYVLRMYPTHLVITGFRPNISRKRTVFLSDRKGYMPIVIVG